MPRAKLRATRPRLRTETDEQFPVETSHIADVDPERYKRTYAAALTIAGGDHRRLRIGKDGQITVTNEIRPERRN